MGWKHWMALVATLTVCATVAQAHGPTRQKVRESVEINAPLEKVWAVVGNFQDQSWHPGVAKTEGEGGNTPKATRVTTLKNGGVINETLETYAPEKFSFSYVITAVDVKVVPATNYSSRITVKPGEGGKTTVDWNGAFYRGYPNNDPPPELSDDAAVKAITGVYRAGLDSLKKVVEGAGS
ncbi:MAG: SRPBCC family protein [Hyphomicrobiales bacterium]|nr:SRPBCC family protein [Hyphomicrobiales bacterium]